ncbi:MAG: hypothetical protein Q4C06_07680 [Bacillota bacterium]|nr:hypothetical protein [Bacillota bacterium]
MTNFVDERVLQARRKIGSETMQLMYYFIVIAFCVKALAFDMALEDCITEFILMIAVPVYQNIRARQMKVVLTTFNRKATKTSTLSGILVAVAVMAFFMWRKEGRVDPEEIISYAVSFSAMFLLVRYGFTYLEKRRAKKLEDEYEDD